MDKTMNSSYFYRHHVSPHLGKHGHLTRVENSLESGTPDVSYSIRGKTGWIEVKQIKDEKIRFEKFQIPWMRRRLRHCNSGDLWVLAFTEDGEYVHVCPAALVVTARYEIYRDWKVICIEDIEVHPIFKSPVNWSAVCDLIVGEANSAARLG